MVLFWYTVSTWTVFLANQVLIMAYYRTQLLKYNISNYVEVKLCFGEGAKKSKKKLTSVSFMYVCVAENAELLVFFYFFLHIPHRQFTLPHPSPNCHQSQKLEFCSYFCPKKCPSFARTFTKMSLSEGLGTLPFQTFLWTLPSDSYWLMLKMANLPPHIKAQGAFRNFLTNFPVRYQLCQLHITPLSQLSSAAVWGHVKLAPWPRA